MNEVHCPHGGTERDVRALRPGKRAWPLTEEQCGQLSKILQLHEIQLIRKSRQLTSEEKQSIISSIDHLFALHRVPQLGEQEDRQPASAPEAACVVEAASHYVRGERTRRPGRIEIVRLLAPEKRRG